MSMKITCEEAVWYILPLIRKEFAKRLVVDQGLTQRKAAEKLGITESAVSQYLSHKRGDFKIHDQEVLKEMTLSAQRIAQGDLNIMKVETCRICHLLHVKGISEKKKHPNI